MKTKIAKIAMKLLTAGAIALSAFSLALASPTHNIDALAFNEGAKVSQILQIQNDSRQREREAREANQTQGPTTDAPETTVSTEIPSFGGLDELSLVDGILQLVIDVSGLLLWLAPVVGVACIVYFQIRKAAADEQEQKRWHDRTITAVVCIIVAVCASAIINLLINYIT